MWSVSKIAVGTCCGRHLPLFAGPGFCDAPLLHGARALVRSVPARVSAPSLPGPGLRHRLRSRGRPPERRPLLQAPALAGRRADRPGARGFISASRGPTRPSWPRFRVTHSASGGDRFACSTMALCPLVRRVAALESSHCWATGGLPQARSLSQAREAPPLAGAPGTAGPRALGRNGDPLGVGSSHPVSCSEGSAAAHDGLRRAGALGSGWAGAGALNVPDRVPEVPRLGLLKGWEAPPRGRVRRRLRCRAHTDTGASQSPHPRLV